MAFWNMVEEEKTFGWALEQLRHGSRVERTGWNGKGMFLFLVENCIYADSVQGNYPNLPFIAMKTADDKIVPWLASQTDILAVDWEVVQNGSN